jgi:hypothetical protein
MNRNRLARAALLTVALALVSGIGGQLPLASAKFDAIAFHQCIRDTNKTFGECCLLSGGSIVGTPSGPDCGDPPADEQSSSGPATPNPHPVVPPGAIKPPSAVTNQR